MTCNGLLELLFILTLVLIVFHTLVQVEVLSVISIHEHQPSYEIVLSIIVCYQWVKDRYSSLRRSFVMISCR